MGKCTLVIASRLDNPNDLSSIAIIPNPRGVANLAERQLIYSLSNLLVDNDSISKRIKLYRQELESSQLSEEGIVSLLDKIWVSKNVFVAETSSEALEIAQIGLDTEQTHFRKARNDFNPTHTITKKSNPNEFESTFIAGTAEDVCEQILELKNIGVSNLMMKMNTGEMDSEIVRKSIKLFADAVFPRF